LQQWKVALSGSTKQSVSPGHGLADWMAGCLSSWTATESLLLLLLLLLLVLVLVSMLLAVAAVV
jgi:hypothetical protein